MRLIQSAVTEVKAIQPSAAQDLLALLPPGRHPSLPEFETGSGGQGGQGGQGGSALLQGQERLHQEGKAALRTLSSTRGSLQEAMEQELQEQRELRAQCRAFFRSVVLLTAVNHECCARCRTIHHLSFSSSLLLSCLCSSQSSLCEDDRLRMKLEFQKCLSAMDRCLVLPHAVSRAKIHSVLAARRRESEEKLVSENSFLLFSPYKKICFFRFTKHWMKLPTIRCFSAAGTWFCRDGGVGRSLLLLVSINLCQRLWRKSVSKIIQQSQSMSQGGIGTVIRRNRYGVFVSP